MKILLYAQGTPEWLAARANHFCASDAPAMMGVSKYKSRSALLREKATGITAEIDANKQARFDAGHATEALARKIIEEKLGTLTPIVATDDDDWLLASYDGMNKMRDVGWEHKLWNEGLADAVYAKDLPPMYYWQLEHQIFVGGLKGVVFTVSDGTPDKMVSMKYAPVPGRAEQLIAGWKQFAEDLANYTPPEVIQAVVAAPTLALPAVSIQVSGAVALTSNLGVFLTELKGFISQIPEKPSSDQEFADCKAACKTLQEAQDALDAAEANAMGQVASFDEMKRAKSLCVDLARNTRLALEKLVALREAQIKGEILTKGMLAFTDHVVGLNKRLGGPYMPTVPANFQNAIKNKRTIASLKDAVETELARVKIEASAIADKIQINLNTLRELAADYSFLFADSEKLVTKANEDLILTIKVRIHEHKMAEEKREIETRDRIRKEESERVEREHMILTIKTRIHEAAQNAPACSSEAATAHVAVPYYVSHAEGISKLRVKINVALDDLTPGQLQEVLDFVREIRATRMESA